MVTLLALLAIAVAFALHRRTPDGPDHTTGGPSGRDRSAGGTPVPPVEAVAPAQVIARDKLVAGEPAAARDSRGQPVPPGVQRLPSGRRPANSKYAGRKFDGDTWTPELAAKYPDGVVFTNDGFPDFSPYATHTVTIDPHFQGDRTDFTQANRLAGLRGTPEGYIWHHHQDTRTMQLVPQDLHEGVRHAGGVAIMKGRK
ncbi:HNH/ENDO VII superfamily nuclease [Saccharothrix carnea]|uniref:HNH/ENDO VII superfamily nuclease n=1 Tax=Saccharothrix carnea TaxID=1280637 RepID=A0A2P8IBK0_SACCR|nr:HNH endonuclease [Saccharothrix carnea]PSL55849.1 HNH/ENDO VII superfamily nuclease [Saccharothrix carnea]